MKTMRFCLVISAVFFLTLCGCGSGEKRTESHKQSCRGITDIYHDLINMLGDQSLPESERYNAYHLLQKCRDEKAIPLLIEAMDDERIFTRDGDRGCRNAEDDTPVQYNVGDMCVEVLHGWFHLHRSSYHIEDWKTWWKQHENKSIDEICEMIGIRAEEQKK